MSKLKHAAAAAAIAYPLMIAAIMAATTAQLPPASAPMEPAAGAPSPGGVDCFTYLLKLSDCLTFVEGGSNLTKPDAGCCPELANLVDTQPVCLCQLLGNPSQTGISVDVKRALKLPAVCNVTTPPVSLCSAFGVPVGDLAPSEAPSPADGGAAGAGAEAAVPSPGGGNGSPTTSKHRFIIGFAALFLTYFF